MTLKIIGALLIVAASVGFGTLKVISHKRSVKAMRQLIKAIETMEHELNFRNSPLPELLKRAAESSEGPVSKYFTALSKELENQIFPDVPICSEAALQKTSDIPELVTHGIRLLSASLGQFGLEEQARSLESVRDECRIVLSTFTVNQESRLRTFQTLLICAGVALVILLI